MQNRWTVASGCSGQVMISGDFNPRNEVESDGIRWLPLSGSAIGSQLNPIR